MEDQEQQEQQEHQAEQQEQQAEERLQQVMEQQVADSIKGKGKGKDTEYYQLSFGSSDEDDFSLDELLKMEDSINFSVALSGNRTLSAKLRRHIMKKQREQQQQQNEEAQQTKQTKTKQHNTNQSINQSGAVLQHDS